MRIITRYVTWEFLKIFFLTLTGLTVFSLVIGVGTEAVKEGLSITPLLRIMPFILPVSMRFSIPASGLLAACVLFGRMSSDNEVVAAKSLGISPLVITAPVAIAGFLISVFAVWVNDFAVSWGKPGAQRVIAESIEQIAYGMLRTRGSFQSERFSIIVKGIEGRKLILPVIKFTSKDEDREIVVAAREAELRRNPEENSLSIYLQDGTIDGEDFEGVIDGTFESVIELPDSKRDGHGQRHPSDFALRDLAAERGRQSQDVTNLEGAMAVDAAFRLVTGDFEGLRPEPWQNRLRERRDARQRISRLRTEPWRRWANSFSCFCFVMVGIPLSIRMRNSDFVTSFFSTFLPILLVYYPLMTYGMDQAKEGRLPQYACWLGNVVLVAWGVWLMRRVIRY